MFSKLDVRRKLIVTLELSSDSRKIVVRYFVNRAPAVQLDSAMSVFASLVPFSDVDACASCSASLILNFYDVYATYVTLVKFNF